MLTADGCAARRERLTKCLTAGDLDVALLTDHRDIYYFTGELLDHRFPAALLLHADGRAQLYCTGQPEPPGVVVESYESASQCTLNPDLLNCLNRLLDSCWRDGEAASSLGYQAEHLPLMIFETAITRLSPSKTLAIDAILADLQSRKDPDELTLIKDAIRCDLAAYDAIQPLLRAGVNELDVLAEGRRAASRAAGEKVFHDGDYQSGELGGPARDRQIEAGEIYIIDAWTVYRGYWSDLCRAFVVDGQPTPLQAEVFAHLAAIHDDVPGLLQPGASSAEVCRQIDARVRRHPHLAATGLVHHGGHATGLRPHEMPDINSERDATLEVGNVICIEPGGYTPELRAGFRLENIYLVTPDGGVNLVDYPFELVPKLY